MVPTPNIKRYCDEITNVFKPRRIILFSSHAYGTPHEDSDVEVLVVMPKSRRLSKHPATDIRLKARCGFPVDMLVWTKDKVARRVSDRDLFTTWITSKGKVMYEADNT